VKTTAIPFVSLFLHLLVTGVFWGTWFTLTRSLERFSAEEFIHIGKVIIANVAVPMRIILPSCILFLGLWVWGYPQKRTMGFYLAVAGLLLIIATLLITLLVLVPIDNQIKEWSAATVPSNWEVLRSRWQVFHSARTFSSLTSFACLALSVLNVKKG
jgi:uncharacterized membrane protein